MALSGFFSGLFRTKDAGADYRALCLSPAEPLEVYLNLTIKCMKQVDSMMSLCGSASLKFNREQCQYLVGKLRIAAQSAYSFLELISTWYYTIASEEDMAQSQARHIFKLLFALVTEVENFVQGCCKVTWIQSAIMLTNVSKHILSLGFNLELCKIVFFTRENHATIPSLTCAQIASISAAEAEAVKEKAKIDEMRLIEDVSALTQRCESGSEEWRMATFLLKRMESLIQHPGPAFSVSNESCDFESLFKNLKDLEILGKGAFGIVHKARWLETEIVAKKTFHGHGSQGTADFLQEVSILGQLHHPNIVSLLWYGTYLRKGCMVMELMDGDLYSLMEKRMEEGGFFGSPFTTFEALDMMLQVGEGMLYLHEKRIVHIDLKSQNILVKCSKRSECYESREVDGYVPFHTLSPKEVKKKVLGGERPQLPDECSQRLRTLIEACWNSNASARPSFNHICAELRHLKCEQLMISAWAKVPRCFSYSEIMIMTNKFSRLLSKQSFSGKSVDVYKGVMVDTGAAVAVLRILDVGNTSSDFDFLKTKFEVWPRLLHDELVRFIGFCREKSELLLLFEDIYGNSRLLYDYEIDSADPIPALVWEANIESYLAHHLYLNMKGLLTFPFQVAKLLRKDVQEARFFREACLNLNIKVEELIEILRELVARYSSLITIDYSAGFYVHPTRRIMHEVLASLRVALELVRNCKKLVTITTTTDFRGINWRSESSIGDITWLLNISSTGEERAAFVGLPPIATTDPVLGLVWEQLIIVHVGTAEEKAERAEYLGNMAKSDERYVRVIIEEAGVPPLLRLLKVGTAPEQVAAATALGLLATDKERVRLLRDEGASSVFTQILRSHSTSMEVQQHVARVVARFASLDEDAQSELASQDAIIGGPSCGACP